ncbi:HEAT repeat domain-containing protein [Streptomyces sp. NPDC057582]|uniref:HEAT repeat domain-containing protein n=1 Tax=Streptomyces sp. NPDC057582 TaxID=3346174 RepID=UPI0036BE29E1
MGVDDAEAATDDELFQRALFEVRTEETDDDPVPALVALHGRPTSHVFERAVRLLARESPDERELGARILRELGPEDETGHRPFTTKTIKAIVAEMSDEPDPWVLGWMISALGYHYAQEALDLVLSYQAHTAQPVRFSVAAALPALADEEHTEARVVEALLTLSEDENDSVRWYALYALFNETVGITDAQKTAWANTLAERGSTERRAELRKIATTLDDDADSTLRNALEQA